MDNNSLNNNQHLSKEELVAYHFGRLSNHEMHRLESHLVDCEFCNAALEGMQDLNKTDLDRHLISVRRRLGIKKDSEGFLHLADKIGLAPNEIFYTDDKATTIDVVKELGINAVVFKSNDQVISEIKKYNL